MERFPQLAAGLEKLEALGQGLYEADLTTLVDKKACSELHAAFGPGVTQYGMATLLGIGKGKMSTLLPLSNATMKSSPDILATGGREKMQARAGRCLEQARHLVAEVVERLCDPRDKVVLDAMAMHFGSKPFSVQHRMVQDKFRQLGDAMSQHLRVTYSSESTVGRKGSVRSRLVDSEPDTGELSPNKTVHHYARDQSIAYGSIHLDAHSLAGEEVQGAVDSDLYIARVLVHEASHKYLATKDLAYVEDLRYDYAYPRLDEYERLQNADCYAFLAASVGAGKAIGAATDFSFFEIPEELRAGESGQEQPEISVRESADDPVCTDSDSSSDCELNVDWEKSHLNPPRKAEDDVDDFMRYWAKQREEQGLGQGTAHFDPDSSGDTSSERSDSSDSESSSFSQ